MSSTQVRLGLIRFGVFEADLQAGELRRDGAKVRLQELPFRALTLLLSRPGEVINRDEFRQALWPSDVFVDFEQGISSAIMRLRTALKDSAENPIFIETVGRRGYRWIAPLHVPELVAEPSPVEPQAAELPTSFLSWRKVLVASAAVALVFAVWIFRARFHRASANVDTSAKTHTPYQPANQQAEDLYLKGRYLWNKRTPESLNQAVDAFTQAIVRDPNYANAYVGLADSFNLLREFSAMPENEAYSRAITAAKKAVELDAHSSEAHATLAFDLYWGEWDASAAETEFRRAIELDANNAKAHHWYATFLGATGRPKEALEQIEIARKLDPTSAAIMADQGELLQSAGRRDEAIELLRVLEKTDPNFASPHRYLWMAYIFNHDYPKFIAELKEDGRLTGDAGIVAEVEAAERGFSENGERGMFEAMMPVQKHLYQQGKLSPYFVAFSAMNLGKTNEAIEYLKIVVNTRDASAVGIPRDPNFASLRGNPDYDALLTKIAPQPSR